MAVYQLQTVNESGEVIVDSELHLEPHDTLIVQVDNETTYERARAIHDLLSDGIKNQINVITVPSGVRVYD